MRVYADTNNIGPIRGLCDSLLAHFNTNNDLQLNDLNEKIKAISKVFSVTRHMANAMIFGHILPPEDQIDRIAEVLDVCPNWLSGRIDKRKAYSGREMIESE